MNHTAKKVSNIQPTTRKALTDRSVNAVTLKLQKNEKNDTASLTKLKSSTKSKEKCDDDDWFDLVCSRQEVEGIKIWNIEERLQIF